MAVVILFFSFTSPLVLFWFFPKDESRYCFLAEHTSYVVERLG
jgi:hypothetical protein